MRGSTRLIIFFICTILVIFIVSLTRSITALWQRGAIVTEREAALNEERQKNEQLQADMKRVESSEFIEEQAREKLNLQREGEVVVVLPVVKTPIEKPVVMEKNQSNWDQWLRLIL